MKNIKHILLPAFLCFVLSGFVACSEDDDNNALFKDPAASVVVSEIGDYNLVELDSKDFIVTTVKFSSVLDWQMYSDKMWVLFSKTENGVYTNDIKGVGGDYTVYMKITNEGRTFDVADANVKIKSGGADFRVCVVSRQAKEYSSQITDEDGNPVASIEIDESASATIKLSANYPMGIKSYPSWVSEPEPYDGGYIFTVLDEYTPFVLSDNVVFASADDAVVHSYPINYAGMSPTTIKIAGDYNPWGWEISLDGKTFRSENLSMDGENEEILVENFIPYTVKCLNYDCKFLFATETKEGAIKYLPSGWLVAEQGEADKSEITVTAQSYTPVSGAKSRKGYLFAVPAAMYETFVAEITVASDATTFVDEHVNYVLVEATQKDIFAPTGFSITDADGNAVACVEETDEDMYNWVSSELSITDVYTMTGVNGVTYKVNTLISEEEGQPGLAFYDADGTVSASRWGRASVKLGDDGYYVVTMRVPSTSYFTQPTVLRLHRNNVNIKALIIKPANN